MSLAEGHFQTEWWNGDDFVSIKGRQLESMCGRHWHGTPQNIEIKKIKIVIWELHCETNTEWVRAESHGPLFRKWTALQVELLTDGIP